MHLTATASAVGSSEVLGHMVFDSREPLAISSECDPVVVTFEMDVPKTPLLSEMLVVISNGDRIGIGSEHLVRLREPIIAEDSTNACACVSETKPAEDRANPLAVLASNPRPESPILKRASS